MLDSLKTIKKKVEYILLYHPMTRDSDKILWLSYMNLFHGLREKLGEEAYQQFKAILLDDNTPTMESIRRIRQKFQEDNKYVGENRDERLQESHSVREWLKKSRPQI